MTHHALHPGLPLTDALERDILEDTLNEPPALHPFAAFKRVIHTVAVAINAFFTLIEVVQDTMSQAYQIRFRSPRSKE
jgi:hypothetical protein